MTYVKLDTDAERYLLFIIGVVIMILCVIGNSLVIVVVYQKRSMRTVTNLLLVNLSLSQLLFGLLVVPITLLKMIRSNVVNLGNLCITYSFIYFFTSFANSFILISVALERFWMIWFTRRKQLDRCVAYTLGLTAWIFSAVASCVILQLNPRPEIFQEMGNLSTNNLPPITAYLEDISNKSPEITTHMCNVLVLLGNFVHVYAAMQWLFPLLLIGILYSLVGVKLSQMNLDHVPTLQLQQSKNMRLTIDSKNREQTLTLSLNNICCNASSSITTHLSDSLPGQTDKCQSWYPSSANLSTTASAQTQLTLKMRFRIENRKKKTIMMLATVVVLFLISWGPLHIYSICSEIRAFANERLRIYLTMLAISNIWYNPLVYCWFSKQYRKHCKRIIVSLSPTHILSRLGKFHRRKRKDKIKIRSGRFRLYRAHSED
ncbi:hypothetical protein Ciccas_014080 [Cichlidogyrus casuarinus]|uniref:G-protein coupled receptors family 1 profile domain-containing protein n=1 Tax=Cichlidogyrus casuarinus TaxID=1844966 RepID=A0ABD2PLW8_9PLAT